MGDRVADERAGAGVIGVAAVVAVSLAFLDVGYSEERARARGESPA